MNGWKKTVKAVIPPIITDILRGLRAKSEYCGNYKTWEDAKKDSTGYDAPEIFEKVKQARNKVLRGEAAYERDGVVFDTPHYFWPLLSCLLYVASKNRGALNVLDIGGSLGTTYFQNLPFLKNVPRLRWVIVEQKQFAEYGKKYLENEFLRFYDTLDDTLSKEKVDVVLLSSALQYFEKPYDMLSTLQHAGLRFFIFDRTAFIDSTDDKITVQHIPNRIFKNARFPAWLFSKGKFKAYFKDKYELMAEFPSIGNPVSTDRGAAEYSGMLLERKN